MATYFKTDDIYCISIRFECPYCQQEVASGYFPLHGADYSAANNSASYVCEDYDATCDSCEEQFYFSICVGKEDGYIELDEFDPDNVRIDVITNAEYDQYHKETFDAISDNKYLFLTFRNSIENLKKLNKTILSSQELNTILKLQIYTGVIGAMETFLSDAMINLTLSDKNLIRNFVEAYPDFTKQKFDLKDIFNEYDKIQFTVKNVLLDTIYHDLRKVREMYRSTFKIEFPDLSEPIKCVLLRHDIVHRNGKSKDGTLLNINTSEVDKTIQIIESFVSSIARSLKLTE